MFSIHSFWERKVKWNTFSLRMKSEKKMSWDREWKVQWNCIEIAKWNFSRILEKFLRIQNLFVYPLCVFKCLFKFHVWVNANLHWLHLVEFFHCRFQMCPQITYFTVNIQMRPQIACLKGCKATLTTFLFDLSPLCFSSLSSNTHSKRMHCHNSRIGQNTPHSVSNSNILYCS